MAAVRCQAGTPADRGGHARRRLPLRALKGTTFTDPQVIADTGLYLNSDLAAKVTGVTIPSTPGT